MTARDDYPLLAPLIPIDPHLDRQAKIALDELDSLRRWKAEALQVLASWEQVWIAAGCPGPLGSSKAESVRRLFERRQEVCGR